MDDKNTQINTDIQTEPALEAKAYTQAELEKLIQAESDRKVTLARSRWEKDTKSKLSEAEKLAKMSEEDKYKYQLAEKEKELAEKEREFALKENKISAMKVLSEKSLPADLVEFVISEDAETTMENIKKLDKHIKDAVAKEVKSRLSSATPTKGLPASAGEMTKEAFNKLTYGQKMELYQTNRELYNKLSGK